MFFRSVCQILTIQGWQLIIGFGSILIATISMFWKFQRARKTDMDKMMEQKADKKAVNEAFKIRDQKIIHVEKVIERIEIDNDKNLRYVKEAVSDIKLSMKENIKELKQIQSKQSEKIDKVVSEQNQNMLVIIEKLNKL